MTFVRHPDPVTDRWGTVSGRLPAAPRSRPADRTGCAVSPLRASIADAIPDWPHAPSKFDWQVMVFGGVNPRTGFPQEPQMFQFPLRSYSLAQIIRRAEEMAERQHRTRFAVRDSSGAVLHVGERETDWIDHFNAVQREWGR
jgi:hypothetical protein